MTEPEEPIHAFIVDTARVSPPDGTVVDLGCGRGPTLAAFAGRLPGARLVGFDRSMDDVEAAREALAGHPGGAWVGVADLRERVPLRDGCADAVVTYNVMECLPDPNAFLAEVERLLRPGGRAVVAHADFDSVVVAGPACELDRRIGHAYADTQQHWMDNVDGRIARKLPGLIRHSRLELEQVRPCVMSSTELTGLAAHRVEDIRESLTASSRRATAPQAPTEQDVAAWYAAVQESAAQEWFYFAETAVVVSAIRP